MRVATPTLEKEGLAHKVKPSGPPFLVSFWMFFEVYVCFCQFFGTLSIVEPGRQMGEVAEAETSEWFR